MKDYNLSFSINLYDEDGDSYSDCILVHLGNGVILQFKNLVTYDGFIEQMEHMKHEIKEYIENN